MILFLKNKKQLTFASSKKESIVKEQFWYKALNKEKDREQGLLKGKDCNQDNTNKKGLSEGIKD